MKLIIATGLYPPEIGGPATYTKFLEKHLTIEGESFLVLPFSSVRKYPRFVRHLIYIFLLLKQTKRGDILYALDTVSVGVPVMLTSFLKRVRYILRVPGDYAWEQGQQRFGITETLDEYLSSNNHRLPVRILAKLQRAVAQRAKHIIVPSEYMKSVVAKWGVQEDKVARIYSELSPIYVPENKEKLRNELNCKGFVLVTSCRLVPWKGVAMLIEVVKELRDIGLDISLEILGDGVEKESLVSHSQSLDISSFVHFRGMLEREEMAKHIKAGDLFVLNTSYEGLSHQLLEVMEIGTPIATTPVGGNVEIVKNCESGLLIPFNDKSEWVKAIKNNYQNKNGNDGLISTARKQLSRFDEHVVSQEFIQLLNIVWKS